MAGSLRVEEKVCAVAHMGRPELVSEWQAQFGAPHPQDVSKGTALRWPARLYTPTHSAKGGRRYFYHTLLSEVGSGSTNSVRRLLAAEIEARVADAIGAFLKDSPNIVKNFSAVPIPGARMLVSAAAHRATVLKEGAEQERATLISRIVSSVVVQSDALEIQLSKGALGAGLLGAGDEGFDG